MPQQDEGLYFDRDTARYVDRYWIRAKEWWNTVRPRIESQFKMFMAYDAYIEARRRAKRTALSFPVIFAHIESRLATMLELLNDNESFIRFEPRNASDPIGILAAERLESAFQFFRSELDWDSKFVDLIQGCDIYDWTWAALKVDQRPTSRQPNMFGSPNGGMQAMPSFDIWDPGFVLVDGWYRSDSEIPVKFKVRPVTYQELVRRYPQKIGTWIKRYRTPADTMDLFKPYEGYREGFYQGYIYSPYKGQRHPMDSHDEYLLVEAHMKAEMSNGTIQEVVYTFLPEIHQGANPGMGTHPYGFPIDARPRPFAPDIDTLVWHARGRPVFGQPRGIGTSELLEPFQRQFSNEVSDQADFVRMNMNPPLMMRKEAYIGQERPKYAPFKVWPFQDNAHSMQHSLDYFVKPLHVPGSNVPFNIALQQQLTNMMELISASGEGSTGAATRQSGQGKTATAFAGRQNADVRRILVPFKQHAATITRAVRGMKKMMEMAPEVFLAQSIETSGNLSGGGILSEVDLMASVNIRVPALSEYANRQRQQVVWRMIADGLAQMPVFAASPGAQIMFIQEVLRSMRIGEVKVQQFTEAIVQGVMMANAATQGQPAQVSQSRTPNGTPPAPTASPAIADASMQMAGVMS